MTATVQAGDRLPPREESYDGAVAGAFAAVDELHRARAVALAALADVLPAMMGQSDPHAVRLLRLAYEARLATLDDLGKLAGYTAETIRRRIAGPAPKPAPPQVPAEVQERIRALQARCGRRGRRAGTAEERAATAREYAALLQEWSQADVSDRELGAIAGVGPMAIWMRLARAGYRRLPPSMRKDGVV